MKLSDSLQSVFSNKKVVPVLFLVLFAGILFMISAKSLSSDKDKIEEHIGYEVESEEKNIENILSQIKGVGDVDVLIVYKSSNENVVLKDREKDGVEQTVFQNETSVNKPYVLKTMYPDIKGAIVVAQGADNIAIKNILADTISAVLEIPIHKVKILEKK